MTRIAGLALSTAVALAACGGLESPDLEGGSVVGRLASANPGAYVYAFGAPGRRASVASDGSFSIPDVPVDTAALVVVDGPGTGGLRRAELVAVQVKGADLTDVGTVDAPSMPLAASVGATAQVVCGAAVVAPKFTMGGTERVDVVAGSGQAAVMETIPAGTFDLKGAMAGFSEAHVSVTVPAGSTTWVAVPLGIDGAGDKPGCVSTGCRSGLRCAANGWCYECLVASDDCAATHGAGYTCDPELFVCKSASATGSACDACSSSLQCGGTGAVCVASGASGYCGRTCSSWSECPAGFDCVSGLVAGQSVCAPPGGCSALYATFGASCFDDSACGALKGGRCNGAVKDAASPKAGYCTAQCGPTSECLAPGYATCNSTSFRCTP